MLIGPESNLSANTFNQESLDSLSGVDAAFAFSSQNILIHSSSHLNLTFMVQAIPISDPPILDLSTTSLPSSVLSRWHCHFAVRDNNIALVGVRDGDVANRRSVWASSIVSGLSFSISLPAQFIGSPSAQLIPLELFQTVQPSISQSLHRLLLGRTPRLRSNTRMPTPTGSVTRSRLPTGTPLPIGTRSRSPSVTSSEPSHPPYVRLLLQYCLLKSLRRLIDKTSTLLQDLALG
jgi:hypothetical protein